MLGKAKAGDKTIAIQYSTTKEKQFLIFVFLTDREKSSELL